MERGDNISLQPEDLLMKNMNIEQLSAPFPVGRADAIASFADGCSYASAFCFVAVSYTHLDVYKRQIFRSPIP